jgi:hypothetical protein
MSRSARIRVINFQTLEREKIRLQAECRLLENQLDQKISYLREHFGSMTLHSILPPGAMKWGTVAEKAKDVVVSMLGNSQPQSFAFGAMRKGLQLLFARQLIRFMSRPKKED